MSKKTIAIVLGSGGHFEQMRRLIEEMGNRFNYELVYIKGDTLAKPIVKDIVKGKKINVVREHYINKPLITSNSRLKNLVYALYGPILTLIDGIMISFKIKSEYIVSAASGGVVFIYYLSKLFGRKLIYIESWSRVWTPSKTGRFLYPIVDKFFVQWPELLKKYPKAEFVGRFG